MYDFKYTQGIDAFMEAHPELNPAWKEALTPVVTAIDEDFYNFIMGFIFT